MNQQVTPMLASKTRKHRYSSRDLATRAAAGFANMTGRFTLVESGLSGL